MTVLVPDDTPECMRQQIHAAAVRMGELAGVSIYLDEYDMPDDPDVLPIDAGEVLVIEDPLYRPGVAAVTVPAQQSGGWRAAAIIGYSATAVCSDYWLTVLMHEFGHVYGLLDTRDRADALMHFAGVEGTWLRQWELEHIRRRIDNAD